LYDKADGPLQAMRPSLTSASLSFAHIKSMINDDAPTLIFLHIPKTAGTTLRSVVRRQFLPAHIHAVDDDNWVVANTRLSTLADEQRRTLRCVIGHFPYGVHAYLPRPARYVTMLRDPVEWSLSFYSVISGGKVNMHIPILRKVAQEGIELRDFPRFLIDNGLTDPQTRAIGGFVDVARMAPPYPPLPPNALHHAKDNLNRDFSVVGLVEKFDESLVLLKTILNWSNVHYRWQNATDKRVRREDVPDALIDEIKGCHPRDVKLYETAASRFSAQIESLEPQFSRDLKRFRQSNLVFNRLSRALGPAGVYVAGRILLAIRTMVRR